MASLQTRPTCELFSGAHNSHIAPLAVVLGGSQPCHKMEKASTRWKRHYVPDRKKREVKRCCYPQVAIIFNPSPRPSTSFTTPTAPGSGTSPTSPTYTVRPRLAFIPLVFSAPFLAASTAACKSPCVSFRVSKKGNSASINVRSPGLAGVYFDKDCWAAIAAVYQSCLVTGRGDPFSAHLRRARDNALKNMLRIHVSAAYPFYFI